MARRSKFAPPTRHAELGEILRRGAGAGDAGGGDAPTGSPFLTRMSSKRSTGPYYKPIQNSLRLVGLCCILENRRADLLTEPCGCAGSRFAAAVMMESSEVSQTHSWQIRGATKQLWWRGLDILVRRGASQRLRRDLEPRRHRLAVLGASGGAPADHNLAAAITRLRSLVSDLEKRRAH